MTLDKLTPAQPRFDWEDISNVEKVVDDLGRDGIARAIAAELRGDTRPRILGIYGWWGAGKSHLLSLVLRQVLEENKKDAERHLLVCVFYPWRYEMEGSLAPGLVLTLQNIENQLPEKQGLLFKGDKKAYKEAAKKLLQLVKELSPVLAPALLPISPAAAATATGIVMVSHTAIDISDTLDEARQKRTPAVDQVREQMEKLVRAILEAAKKSDPSKEYRLIVFIDDLDRCSPSNMVRMFEWLKVHLRVKDCTYVLALDHVAAARAIVGHYREYLTSEKDLAYGFRYLEKLVDYEYELQLAPKVETMALKQVYGPNYSRLSDAAREVSGGDFPGIEWMNSLLETRSLLTPRTMLKIVYRYQRTLEVIGQESQFRSSLPAAYPFWALLLIAMYYTLDPDILDEYIRGRGNIFDLMRKYQVNPSEWGTGPLREFCQYASRFGDTAGTGMQIPSLPILQRLASIIRENALPPA